MKIFVSLFLCYFYSLIVLGQVYPDPLTIEEKITNRNNKIKEKRAYHVGNNDSSLAKVEKFDTDGKLTDLETFSIDYKVKYFYTDSVLDSVFYIKDNIINVIRYKYLSIDKFAKVKRSDSYFNYCFLSNNYLVKLIDEEENEYNWFYNIENKLVKKTAQNPNDSIQIIENFIYNDVGLLQHETMYKNWHEKIRKVSYFYDDFNNIIIEVFLFYRDNKLVDTSIVNYEYNDEKLKIKKSLISKGKVISEILYSYDFYSK